MSCWGIVICHNCGDIIAPTDEYHTYQEKAYCIGCWRDFRDEIGWENETDLDLYYNTEEWPRSVSWGKEENYLDE